MADTRTYARIDDHMPENEKIVPLSDAAAWMHVSGILYCSRNLTDGKVPKKIIGRLVHGNARKLVQELTSQELWKETGDFYEIHDYLEHQRSRADIEQMRRKARERAAKSRRTLRVTDDEVTEPEAEASTKASNTPPSPPQGGHEAPHGANGKSNPRSNGTSPRQVAKLRSVERLRQQIVNCPECGDTPGRDCARCARLRIELRELEATA